MNDTYKDKSLIFKKIYKNYIIENEIKNYIVMDFETTGLDPLKDRITEFTILKYTNGTLTKKMTYLVNPNMEIPQIVIDKTGITNEMVSDKLEFMEYIEEFMETIDNNIVVGHNIMFDLKFLNEEIIRYNNTKYFKKEIKYIDTLDLVKLINVKTKDHKLETLKEYLKIDTISHRSENDCLVTNELLKYCIKELKNI